MTETAGVFVRELPALDRWVQIGVAGGKLISLSFPTERPADAGTDHPTLDRIEAAIREGDEDLSDVEVGLTVPTDQRRVLEALRAVPPGRSVSVDRVASMSGLDEDDEDDLALVRKALAGNPIPLVIPGHRVRDGPDALPPDVAAALREREGL